MKFIVTSDTHFSSRPKDAYRFGLFPWLIEQQKRHNPDATFLLGDLTEDKDRHSSSLVNQLVSLLKCLKPPVYILRGNHDGIDPMMPYFHFLNHIDWMTFVTKQRYLPEFSVMMIPHQTSQGDMDVGCEEVGKDDTVFLHNTFDGAIAETGATMGGLQPPPRLYKARVCVSGDIHRPQQVGPIAYCGAPYQVRFGDDYTPRILLIDNDKFHDLHFPAPKKWSLQIRDHVDILNHKDLTEGDQVKLTIELAREEVVSWAKIKDQVLKACSSRGVEVYGVEMRTTSINSPRIKQEGPTGRTTQEYFKSFCVSEDVPAQMKQAGLAIIGGKDVSSNLG